MFGIQYDDVGFSIFFNLGELRQPMCMLFSIFTHQFLNMRTNIELDDALVNQAKKLSKLKTKREVVQEALKNYIAFMKKKELLNLKGQVTWEGNLKEMRSL